MNFASGMIEVKRFEPQIRMPISLLQSLRRPESDIKESAPQSLGASTDDR